MKKKQAKPKPKPKSKSEMSLLEHLDELRQRLLIVIIALLVGTIAGAIITEPVFGLIITPAQEAGIDITAFEPAANISTFFKVSLVIGTVLAMPVIMYQLFAYAAPGLESNEKRYILIGVPFASLSFAAGAVFAGLVALPRALPFMSGILSKYIKPEYGIVPYLTFVTNIMLWSGFVFETPLVMYFLAKLGVVRAQGFAKAWRYVFVGGAVASAIVTPTVDILNMMLIMGPFLLLYGLGILLAFLAQRGRD
jgi:sec-independent protein translocase protein TatC